MTTRALSTARLRLEPLEDRSNPSTAYLATDLIADQPGVAPITDPTLVNAWGISLNPNGAFWVSANGMGLSEVYGNAGGQLSQPFKVNVPSGAPTGQVFAGIAGNFVVSGVNAAGAAASGPSAFIFASESGQITAWNPGIYPAKPAAPGVSTNAIVGYSAQDGAIYKGLALATVNGANYLFATDFHNNKIDVLDGRFQKVTLGAGGFESFTDPNLPAGYAPFNVALIGGKLYVSYAKQDADAHDDVAGRGNGFVSVFETNGHFDGRLVSRGDLNSPWGMVQAPASFGDFANALLVGNFGDGKIHAYDVGTGKELGTLSEAPGRPIVIDGLWGLSFGNAKTAQGGPDTLFYAAGPDGEAHGLFGKITANAAGTNPVSATLNGGDLVITGSRDGDRVEVELQHGGQQIVVEAGGQKIGTFDAAAVGTIHFTGLAGDDVFVVDPHVAAMVVADGGAGDDVLIGGGGSGILVGNTGNDVLVGGSARDILAGGAGHDFLFGFGDDDILIGGSTAYDSNPAALTQILTAWNSGMSYNDRVDAIRAGTGGVPKLDATTVTDDGSRDDLFGGPGLDWYFSNEPDRVHGKKGAERVN
jgi:uncharacterized protein (TIGR03118 family)